MIPLAQSVASSTLQAGRKPPSGIFITVAWGSVVDRPCALIRRLGVVGVPSSLVPGVSTTGPPGPVPPALAPRAPAPRVPAASHRGRGAPAPAPADPPDARAFSRHIFNPPSPRKDAAPALDPHSHPVLSHTLQPDRSCGHQGTYDLGQKTVQRLLMLPGSQRACDS